MRLLVLAVACVSIRCRCDDALLDAAPTADVHIDQDLPEIHVAEKPDVKLPLDGGLDAFVPTNDGGYIAMDRSIVSAIRRIGPDLRPVWNVEILQLDYPSELKVLDMLVVEQSVWVALEIDKLIEIAKRRYKPRRGERDVLLLRLDLETGRVLAHAQRRGYRVHEARFAAFRGDTYFISLAGRDGETHAASLDHETAYLVELERLRADASAQWSLATPNAFVGTLELAATRDAVYVVARARAKITFGNKTLLLPPIGYTRDRYWRAKVDVQGRVQELELPPFDEEALQVAFATDGVTEMYALTGGDRCRAFSRAGDGTWTEKQIPGVHCSGPSVLALPGAFLIKTFWLVLKQGSFWQLTLVSPSGRVLATTREEVTRTPDPYLELMWNGRTVDTYGRGGSAILRRSITLERFRPKQP